LFGGFARLSRLGSCLALRDALSSGCDRFGASDPALGEIRIAQRSAIAF